MNLRSLLLGVLVLARVCYVPCKGKESESGGDLDFAGIDLLSESSASSELTESDVDTSSSVILCGDKEGYDLDPNITYPECCDMDERECSEGCYVSVICKSGLKSTGYQPYGAVCVDIGDGLKWWGKFECVEDVSDTETHNHNYMRSSSIERANTGGPQQIEGIGTGNNEDSSLSNEFGAENGGKDIQERTLLQQGEESLRKPPPGVLLTKETSGYKAQSDDSVSSSGKSRKLRKSGKSGKSGDPTQERDIPLLQSCCVNPTTDCCGVSESLCCDFDVFCCPNFVPYCCINYFDDTFWCCEYYNCYDCIEAASCFSAKSEVTLLSSYGPVPAMLEDITSGDRILAFDENGESFFDEVYWIHYIHLKGNASPMLNLRHEFGTLRLTADHLVYIAEKRELFSDTCIDLDNQKICVYEARHANVGDSIWVVNPETMQFELRQITSVTFTREKFLNPVTFSGNLVVDGVAVSSFCKRHDFGMESTFPIRMVYYLCGDCTNHIYADYVWESLGNIRRGLRDAAMYLPPGWGKLTMFLFYFVVLSPVLCPIVFLVKKFR